MLSTKQAVALTAALVLSGAATSTVVAAGQLRTPDRSARGKQVGLID
jgi:hypothetical protein